MPIDKNILVPENAKKKCSICEVPDAATIIRLKTPNLPPNKSWRFTTEEDLRYTTRYTRVIIAKRRTADGGRKLLCQKCGYDEMVKRQEGAK